MKTIDKKIKSNQKKGITKISKKQYKTFKTLKNNKNQKTI